MKMNKFGLWGFSSLNGILMLIFGVIAIVFPSLTISMLGIYFAIAIMLGGLVLSVFAIRQRQNLANWRARLIEGLLSLALGIVIILYPNSAAAFLLVIVGLWALFIGVVFIATYFSKNTPELTKAFSLIAGLVSLVLGAIVVFNPFESTRFLVILIGIYALAYGLFTMVYSSKFLKAPDEDKTDILE